MHEVLGADLGAAEIVSDVEVQITAESEAEGIITWDGATYYVRTARDGEEPTRTITRCCAGTMRLSGPPVVATLVSDARNHGHTLP